MIRVEWVVLKSRACFGNRRSNINETCLGLIQNLKEVLNQFSTKLQGHVYFNKQGERKGVTGREREGSKRERTKTEDLTALSVFFDMLEYGITHGSVLEMRRDRGKSSAASGESGDADVLMCEEE